MELTVRNFRGIESASITLAPVALVCAPNGIGKTSIAQALACALTGNPIPFADMPKNKAALLLRDGAQRGKVTIAANDNERTVNYPGASISGSEDAPQASPIAAGLTSLATTPVKMVPQLLAQYLPMQPTVSDLHKALHGTVDDSTVAQLWARIEQVGWDDAHRGAKDFGTKAKGKWEQITGEAFGAVKAQGWRSRLLPEDATVDDLKAAVAKAQAAYDKVVGDAALDDAERQQLQQLVDGATLLKSEAQVAAEDMQAKAGQIDAARDALQALPQPGAMRRALTCVHCQGQLELQGQQLVAFVQTVDPTENQRRQEAIDKARALLTKLQDEHRAMAGRQHQREADLQQAQRAAARLAAFEGKGTSTAAIEQARYELEAAQDVVAAWHNTQEAARCADTIAKNIAICAALDFGGVRKAVLERALGAFNAELMHLCALAMWDAVSIGEDMTVSYGGRPYALLSASQQFRARVILQVAMARIDKSAAVVIDAADILDRAGRNGLFALLRSVGIPALVTSTANAPDEVPRLAAAGIGRSYWIDNGNTTEL